MNNPKELISMSITKKSTDEEIIRDLKRHGKKLERLGKVKKNTKNNEIGIDKCLQEEYNKA